MDSPKPSAKGAAKTILFVDDDPFFRKAMTEILTANGYSVQTAEDGLEALARVQQVRPDYLVLDVVLPKLDGGEVCAALRQDARLRDVPVIVFSSLSADDFRFFPNLSADAYVAKAPLAIASQHLLTALQRVAGREPGQWEGFLLGYASQKSRRLVTELLLQRRHLRALVAGLVPGAVELNPDGRIILANPGACTLLGKEEKELVGTLFSSLLSPADEQRVQALLGNLSRSELPTDRQTAFRVGSRQLVARLTSIREGGTCTALVVILDEEVRQAEQK